MKNYSVYFTPEDESYGCRDMTEEEKAKTDKYFRQMKAWYMFREALPDRIRKILEVEDLLEVAKDLVRYNKTPDEYFGFPLFKEAADKYYSKKVFDPRNVDAEEWKAVFFLAYTRL